MRISFIIFLFFITGNINAQGFNKEALPNLGERISTIDFVEIVDGNLDETLFYYNNNWKILRQKAQSKNYILSYQLLQTPLTEDNKIQLLLITTYANQDQYDKREEHFQKLIKAHGGLKLLNDKRPGEFRRVAFFKEPVKHLN